MKKLLLTLCAATALPGVAAANGFEFSQSGMAGVYYGVMETRDNNNVSNMPNRLVFRSDGNLEGAYKFENQTRLGVHADYTLVFRQHDKDYNDGDWRFYPYALAENPKYGKFTVGHTYNAAFQLHQGAQEITWIGIQDSNLPYWLTSANWVNGLKTVKFATPKSTNIMDDGRSFKFSYFTPMIGNTKFGFSYAPDNASRRGMVSRYTSYQKKEDGYTAAMQNKWNPGLGDLYTSVAYGLFNRTDNEWAFGVRWVVDKFNVSTSYKNAYIDGDKNPISTTARSPHLPAYFDNYREGEAWDFSVGYDFGRFKTNFAYLHSEAKNTRNRDDIFIQANRYSLNEYFELFWVNAYSNSKGVDRNSDNNNKGYAVITGIALKY
ncbi:MAG: porin [Azospirillum sp.]|nr:porin [Azospirillum sp.]